MGYTIAEIIAENAKRKGCTNCRRCRGKTPFFRKYFADEWRKAHERDNGDVVRSYQCDAGLWWIGHKYEADRCGVPPRRT